MKKTLLIAAFAFGLVNISNAQNNNNNNGRGNQNKAEHRESRADDDDDNYQDRRNGRYDDSEDHHRGRKGKSYGYERNIPKKVLNAFYTDYGNVRNVRWTKERNIYTARFYGGTASYAANGNRVNGAYGNNDDWNNGQLPTAVQNAFNRDYPAASNVSWQQSGRNIWTATFRNGFLGGTQTASYYSNGERANDNGNNNDNGQYVPNVVRNAFNRDFPTAKNVSWSFNRANRLWTASFSSGLFNTPRTASYDTNGNRQ